MTARQICAGDAENQALDRRPEPAAGRSPAAATAPATAGPAAMALLRLQRAAGNRAVGAAVAKQRAARPPTVQRNVGLELEHNVPVYRNLPKASQELSLRQGSYKYDNNASIYQNGDITTKVDNSEYGKKLAAWLEANPGGYVNKLPEKGVSILEYTTTAPGLDELQKDALGTFKRHVGDVKAEIQANQGGRAEATFYTGLPAGVHKHADYGELGFQVTVGVFPSKLDQLHRRAAPAHMTSDLRRVQEDIDAIMATLEEVRARMVENLKKKDVLGKDSDAWSRSRLTLIHRVDGADAVKAFEAEVEVMLGILDDIVRSLFRVALSYYLGARRPVPIGQVEKNAVPLLARMRLQDVFASAGPRPALWSEAQRAICEELGKENQAIQAAVASHQSRWIQYERKPNTEVLEDIDPVELMIRMLRGEDISHIGPGTHPAGPDPIDLVRKGYQEPERPEQGGTQVEYRTLASAGWDRTFLEIAKDAFELNIQHLDESQQDQLRTDTGWRLL